MITSSCVLNKAVVGMGFMVTFADFRVAEGYKGDIMKEKRKKKRDLEAQTG